MNVWKSRVDDSVVVEESCREVHAKCCRQSKRAQNHGDRSECLNGADEQTRVSSEEKDDSLVQREARAVATRGRVDG